jgi:hypothetical protein
VATSGPLSHTDQALATALAAWGGTDATRLIGRFEEGRADSLLEALSYLSVEPLQRLRSLRDAQIGPDPGRVHSSWYVRALQDEAPSVRRVVTASTPEPLRSILMRGLQLTDGDLTPDRPADNEAVDFARTLWTERLVGDLPRRDDDRLAITAIADLSQVGLYRLFRLCGLAKLSTLADRQALGLRLSAANRVERLSERFAEQVDPRLAKLAASDWAAAQSLGRHRLAGLGLTTMGRLLAAADPYRTRWALQHVPYPIAKRLRTAASQSQAAVTAVLIWEARTLEVAWEVLREVIGPSREPRKPRSHDS